MHTLGLDRLYGLVGPDPSVNMSFNKTVVERVDVLDVWLLLLPLPLMCAMRAG